jgi:uncharacterized protein (TIGR00299 family) protein
MKPLLRAWVDVSAGVAGDMLLGALLDAGAPLDRIQEAVDAVVPGSVRLRRREAHRGGMRAAKLDVEVLIDDPPRRAWPAIRASIETAGLPPAVRDDALRVFGRLALAEGRVHGIDPDEVHFHEVGSLDSIADVVGTCAALHHLGVQELGVGVIAVGSGQVTTEHGVLPVPVPAVLELSRGWAVTGGGPGELATPTGVALVTTLGRPVVAVPTGVLVSSGVGAGTRQVTGRANVVRVVLLEPAFEHAGDGRSEAVVLEANVDDLDPRLWPGVLDVVLQAGADDAWLVPIQMKKGRPAHTLCVLCPPAAVGRIRRLVFERTSTIGVREYPVLKTALERSWVAVAVAGGSVGVKVAHQGGRILSATPEFKDVAALASTMQVAERAVLGWSVAAAQAAALSPGAQWPPGVTGPTG